MEMTRVELFQYLEGRMSHAGRAGNLKGMVAVAEDYVKVRDNEKISWAKVTLRQRRTRIGALES